MADIPYKRILLKVSGEVLAGDQNFGIEAKFLSSVAAQIVETAQQGVQIAIVIGAGNIFRGLKVAAEGGDRVTGDLMGMLGTVINSLALAQEISKQGVDTKVFSSLPMHSVADVFTARDAKRALKNAQVVICGGGTGNPFFTTDTAAALKAIELDCDILLKGTKVDGIYSADPEKDPNAARFETISHEQVISNDLRVMDTAAFALARDNKLPILVYALDAPGGLSGVLKGQVPSTRVG